jgi:branched-subunit amino acid transport protein
VSWALILGLAAGAYLFKAGGLVLLGGRSLPPALDRCLALLPAALLAAIVVVETLGADRRLAGDPKAVGVAVAALATWRRAPFWLVVVLAAAVTAGLRALGA